MVKIAIFEFFFESIRQNKDFKEIAGGADVLFALIVLIAQVGNRMIKH